MESYGVGGCRSLLLLGVASEAKPKPCFSDVLQALMDVLVTELKELHNSLVRYECDNFVLTGLLIVHGAPPADRFLRKAVNMSKEKKRRGQRPTSSF